MFINTPIETKLEAEIQSALNKLESIQDKTSEEYGTIVDRISKLHKLKTEEVEQASELHKMEREETEANQFGFSKKISPDTVLAVAANIFGILLMTRYERENVITSKALSFLMRPDRH